MWLCLRFLNPPSAFSMQIDEDFTLRSVRVCQLPVPPVARVSFLHSRMPQLLIFDGTGQENLSSYGVCTESVTRHLILCLQVNSAGTLIQ